MARPVKNNADYFSHDKDMRDDPKIKFIRSIYGLIGYAIYNCMLEYLTRCDNFETKRNSQIIMFLAGDFVIDKGILEKIIKDCIEAGLFILEGDVLYSNGLKKRLEEVVENRKKKRERANNRRNNEKVLDVENSNNDIENHAKEKKVKEKKINNNINTNKTDFIGKIRNAQTLGKTYIQEREKKIGKKTALIDSDYIILGEIMKKVPFEEFSKLLDKYLKICEFIRDKEKYLLYNERKLPLYSFTEFLKRIDDLFLLEEKEIIKKIQNYEGGDGKLLKLWSNKNLKKPTTLSKFEVPKQFTEEEIKENKFRKGFLDLCIIGKKLKAQKAMELWIIAKSENRPPGEVLEEYLKTL